MLFGTKEQLDALTETFLELQQLALPSCHGNHIAALTVGLDERLKTFTLDAQIADFAGQLRPLFELIDNFIDSAGLGQRFSQRQNQPRLKAVVIGSPGRFQRLFLQLNDRFVVA